MNENITFSGSTRSKSHVPSLCNVEPSPKRRSSETVVQSVHFNEILLIILTLALVAILASIVVGQPRLSHFDVIVPGGISSAKTSVTV
jgi:hypothetical protein